MVVGPEMHKYNHQSWSLNVEPGDRHVLPSGVENDAIIQTIDT